MTPVSGHNRPENGDESNPVQPDGTQAVVRAVRLLKAIAKSRHPLSLDELAKDLGLAKPTAHRILSALIREEMVEQHPATRFFIPGRESLALSANAIQHHDLRSLARPVLEKLVLLSGETATLEIPVRTEMLILDEVMSSSLVGAHAEIGTRWPMYATSSGKITLSTFSEKDISAYMKHPRIALTKATLVSEEKLMEELEKARQNRYAIAEGELQSTFSAVSAAIKDVNGKVVATISIGGPGDRLNRSSLRRFGSMLWVEAQKLERPASMVTG